MKDYSELYDDEEKGFRDSLSTVGKDGKRIWVFPKMQKGQFYRYRTYISWLLLAILFIGPFIRLNGAPFILVNIFERKFILFGIVFMPQDFWLFALAMITMVLFVVLFTVVFGRLFCGWVCPQTIFMEGVFRKIEYFIEGDSSKQRRLDKAAWNGEKIRKRGLKYFAFYMVSFTIANLVASYIVGSDTVLAVYSDPFGEYITYILAIIVFSFVFYTVFASLREQVCTTICPYGRLQGVMLTDDSLVIAYDYKRGEPRGKLSKKKSSAKDILNLNDTVDLENGDCVDCNLCVRVCPTGIDIRNGTQLECINCTLCMDACDEIMEKVDKPVGLIRYDSHNGIEAGHHKLWTPRVIAYTVVLSLLIIVQAFFLLNRSSINFTVLRAKHSKTEVLDNGRIRNLYNFEIVNKSLDTLKNIIIATDLNGSKVNIIGRENVPFISPEGMFKGTMFIDVAKKELHKRKTPLKVIIKRNDKMMVSTKVSFVGPRGKYD